MSCWSGAARADTSGIQQTRRNQMRKRMQMQMHCNDLGDRRGRPAAAVMDLLRLK